MAKMCLFGLAILVSTAACDPTLSEDFDSFCRVVNETNKQTNIPAIERLLLISGRAPEYSMSSDSKATDNVWKKMDALSTDKRYAFLSETARASGKADYKCSGYEKLLVTATVEQERKQKAADEKAAVGTAGSTPDAGVSPDAGTEDKKSKKAKKAKKSRKKRR